MDTDKINTACPMVGECQAFSGDYSSYEDEDFFSRCFNIVKEFVGDKHIFILIPMGQ